MFSDRHYPKTLTKKQLDEYLASGWFRMGQLIFTCHFLFFQGQIYSPIWIRLALENYVFSKGLQRLWKRNRHLQTSIQKADFTTEKEQLYQKYRENFDGTLADTLADSLLDGKDKNIYNTYEVCVYDGEKLVAFSFFDVGSDSVASIMGVYDPDYAKFSLGFYTMLLEIKYSMQQQMHYYYPGYVVHDYSKFDYKLRIGKVDYFNVYQHSWLPYTQLETEEIPIVKLQSKLNKIQYYLNKYKIDNKIIYYPLYDEHIYGCHPEQLLNTPLFINCYDDQASHQHLVITYNLESNHFELNIYKAIKAFLGFIFVPVQEAYLTDGHCIDFLILQKKIGSYTSAFKTVVKLKCLLE